MKGLILDITFRNGLFIIRLDGKVKEFKGHDELDRWLIKVLNNAKDQTKKNLLAKDLQQWFKSS